MMPTAIMRMLLVISWSMMTVVNPSSESCMINRTSVWIPITSANRKNRKPLHVTNCSGTDEKDVIFVTA